MTTTVLTGVSPRLDSTVARLLEQVPGLVVVRRCADLAELLSTASAGLAELAVVSADLRGLDRDALRHLAGHGVRPVGVLEDGDEDGERQLRQLGVSLLVRLGDDPLSLTEVLATPGALDPGTGEPLGLDPEESMSGVATTTQGWAGGDRAASEDIGSPTEPTAGRIVAVWGAPGAPGRTTLAVNLASVLAADGRTVLLVDLDTWSASVGQFLGLIDEAPGVAAAARSSEQGRLDVPSLARIAPEVGAGLRVLTGLPAASRWPELRAGSVENLLDVARHLAGTVVVDLGAPIEQDEELSYDTNAPQRNAAALTTLAAADEVLVVGAGDPVGLQRLVRAAQALAEQGVSGRVVVNKTRAAVAGPHPERAIAAVLDRFAGLAEPVFLPWAGEDCDAALLAGRAVVEIAPEGDLARALTELARVVGGAVGAEIPATRSRRRHRMPRLRPGLPRALSRSR